MQPPALDLDDLTQAATVRMRIVWAAFTASIGVYVVLLFALLPGAREPVALHPALGAALHAQAALLALASLYYRRCALSESRLRRAMDRLDGPELPGADRTDLRLYRVLAHLQIVDVVVLCLNEAIALAGFALAFVTGEPERVLVFALLAVAANGLVFPRPAAVLEHARSLALLPTSVS